MWTKESKEKRSIEHGKCHLKAKCVIVVFKAVDMFCARCVFKCPKFHLNLSVALDSVVFKCLNVCLCLCATGSSIYMRFTHCCNTRIGKARTHTVQFRKNMQKERVENEWIREWSHSRNWSLNRHECKIWEQNGIRQRGREREQDKDACGWLWHCTAWSSIYKQRAHTYDIHAYFVTHMQHAEHV